MSEFANLSFEDAYTRLETIVQRLEGETLPLNEALELFEKGQRLANFCQQLLEAAELRVSQISSDNQLKPLSD
jgi:exodeoxyribonuclease VII small subunit